MCAILFPDFRIRALPVLASVTHPPPDLYPACPNGLAMPRLIQAHWPHDPPEGPARGLQCSGGGVLSLVGPVGCQGCANDGAFRSVAGDLSTRPTGAIRRLAEGCCQDDVLWATTPASGTASGFPATTGAMISGG